jgi:hypothetical protein
MIIFNVLLVTRTHVFITRSERKQSAPTKNLHQVPIAAAAAAAAFQQLVDR